MARLLSALKPDRAQRAACASELGVTERTLTNWQRRLSEPGRPEGRPPHSLAARRRCARAVLRELRQDGYRLGEEEVMDRLKIKMEVHPQRLVRWALKGLKAKHRRRLRAIAKKLRLRLAPLEEDVLWSLDATHLGYQADNSKLEGQVIVDVKDGEPCALSLGASPTSDDAIMLLEHAKKDRGQLPLALSIDNGYDSSALRRYLHDEGVLLLRNLPYTPEHNTWAECAMKPLKDGIKDRVELDQLSGERAIAMTDFMLVARESLIDLRARRRARLGPREQTETQNERDTTSRPHYDPELRARLARRLAWRLERIPAERCSARRRRLLERYAIFETLLEAGMVSLTRGGRPWDQVEWERLT